MGLLGSLLRSQLQFPFCVLVLVLSITPYLTLKWRVNPAYIVLTSEMSSWLEFIASMTSNMYNSQFTLKGRRSHLCLHIVSCLYVCVGA